MKQNLLLFMLCLAACCGPACAQQDKAVDSRPNIIIIVSDDLGYSDIGCFGGEIPTPNLDNLAENGIRLAQFYNHARCCPTRASLMTGLDNHQVGIGDMTMKPEKLKKNTSGNYYGYTGQLNFNCMTIAEVLKNAGYHTYMAGKWHLGFETIANYPVSRGFEKFYGFLGGGTNYFHPHGPGGSIYYNTKKLEITDTRYYTSDAFTDSAIAFVEGQKDDEPFFLYLAFNAAHLPLLAREQDIAKVKGLYDKGWDVVRDNRFKKMKDLGLVSKDFKMSASAVMAWDKLTQDQKDKQIGKMNTYAAIIYNMDQNIGRLMHHLRRSGKAKNTLIIYLSDNGATFHTRFWNMCDAPFVGHKRDTYEGGISANAVVSWPEVIPQRLEGTISQSPGDIIDIMPTVLEVSGAKYPAEFHGHRIQHLEGHSLLPVFETGARAEPKWFDWEHVNNYAVRSGKWKAVKPNDKNAWELYNIENDRGETNNLAERFPGQLKKLTAHWRQWADTHYVFPKPESEKQFGRKKINNHHGKKSRNKQAGE